MRAVFRVDAGRVRGIALGHAFRCLALAQELRSSFDAEALFVMRDLEGGPSVVRRRGFPVLTLAESAGAEEESRVLLQAAGDVYVFDLIGMGPDAPAAIMRSGKRVVLIDDSGRAPAHADIVVCGNAGAGFDARAADDGRAVWYRGPEYCILGSGFADAPPRRCSGEIRGILVTMGGADPAGLTERVVAELADWDRRVTIEIVLGPAVRECAAVGSLASRHPGMRVSHDVGDLAALMRRADVGICAGGRTLYEMAATGTPAVVIPSIGHEERFVERLLQQGERFFRPLLPPEIPRLGEVLRALAPPEVRQAMSGAGQRLIDGRGCRRVAAVLAAAAS